MSENSMFEHELEQMRLALAQTLYDEVDLNLREALELADHFYGEVATSLESAESAELAEFGSISHRSSFAGINRFGIR